jgi:hypothetical protein
MNNSKDFRIESGADFLESVLKGEYPFPFDEVQSCAQAVSALALVEANRIAEERNTQLEGIGEAISKCADELSTSNVDSNTLNILVEGIIKQTGEK